MKQLVRCFLLCFIILFKLDVFSANKHKYGVPDLGGDVIFFRKIIDQVNEVPKNYTIIFKYMTGKVSPMMSYFEIDVNVFSEGTLKVTNEMKTIDATISIPNASNVTATVSLRGFGMNLMPILRGWPFDKGDTSSKSMTAVYVKNASPTQAEKTFTSNSIGKRQAGDQLIHFESRNVTNVSRFPSRSFEYSGEDSITYVGFSFNSATAMALVNTTFISEKDFSTVVYDMNTEHFVANISVYGYRHASAPTNYVNLLGEEIHHSQS